MLGFHSSRDIMTVEPRGWCSGETFHLGLAQHRPASWEAGLVRCGLISTTRTGVKSPPRESLPRMRRQAGQGCRRGCRIRPRAPPAGLFQAVCLVCPPQSSKGSCMRHARQGEGRRCRDRSLVVAPMRWLHISLLARLDYLTVYLSVLLKRAAQRSLLLN